MTNIQKRPESYRQTGLTRIGSEELHLPQMRESGDCPNCGETMICYQLPAFLDGQWTEPICLRCAEEQEKNKRVAEQAESEKRRHQEKIDRYLDASCVGTRFRGMSFDDYRPINQKAEKVLEDCRLYASDFRRGSGKCMIFAGTTGTGKNMLSAIIGQEIIKTGHSFLHTSAMKLVRKFKDSWKDRNTKEEDLVAFYVGPDLLVIDEVGVQFGSATEQLYLTEIINDRYEARKSTILLSNLTVKQIGDAIGERAVERFYEDGSKVLVFNWQSYRKMNSTALQVVRAA